jgi:hypothetical protein
MTADAKLQKMSMYSELLAASFDRVEQDDLRAREELLLEELSECRARLTGTADDDAPAEQAFLDAFGHIAREIDYDLALIRVCRLHGIDSNPALFTRPLEERRRLEQALEAAGVDLES